MTPITMRTEQSETGAPRFRAIAGQRQSVRRTMGEALDALTADWGDEFQFEVEHVLPQARGGTDTLDNLALTCHACNLFKSDFETGPDKESQTEVALFHPRRDLWEEHFAVHVAQAEIVDRTPVGRATIRR